MIKKIDHWINQITVFLLSLSFFSMLMLSFGAIVMRWLGSSPMWIDPLVRHLVLVCAFLGGSLATGKKMHIKMDVFARPLEKTPFYFQKALHTLLSLITFLIVAGLCFSAYEFWKMEAEFGGEAFLGLKSSNVVLIIPLGFSLIALRTFLQVALELQKKQESHHAS